MYQGSLQNIKKCGDVKFQRKVWAPVFTTDLNKQWLDARVSNLFTLPPGPSLAWTWTWCRLGYLLTKSLGSRTTVTQNTSTTQQSHRVDPTSWWSWVFWPKWTWLFGSEKDNYLIPPLTSSQLLRQFELIVSSLSEGIPMSQDRFGLLKM